MVEKNYQFAVVIINYKTPQLVNASQDGSCGLTQEWVNQYSILGQVELLHSRDNSEFSGSDDQAEANNYLLLNSDALARKIAISLLLEAA